MNLVHNERFKLAATYANGLAIAAAAIGGISQIVATGSLEAFSGTAAWIGISLGLHLGGQAFIGRLRE